MTTMTDLVQDLQLVQQQQQQQQLTESCDSQRVSAMETGRRLNGASGWAV